jgi:chromosome segregation ATPase
MHINAIHNISEETQTHFPKETKTVYDVPIASGIVGVGVGAGLYHLYNSRPLFKKSIQQRVEDLKNNVVKVSNNAGKLSGCDLLATCKEELDAEKRKSSKLQDEVDIISRQLSDIREQVLRDDNVVVMSDKVVQDVSASIAFIKQRLEDRKKLLEERQLRINELESILLTKDQRISDLTNEVSQIREQLDACDKDKATKLSQYETLQTKFKRLEAKCKDTGLKESKEMVELRKQLHDAKDRLKKKKESIRVDVDDDVKSDLADIDNNVGKVGNDIENIRCNEDLKNCKLQLNALSDKLIGYKIRLRVATVIDNDVDGLDNIVNAIIAKHTENIAKLEDIQRLLDECERERDVCNNSLVDCKTDLRGKNAFVKTLEQTIGEKDDMLQNITDAMAGITFPPNVVSSIDRIKHIVQLNRECAGKLKECVDKLNPNEDEKNDSETYVPPSGSMFGSVKPVLPLNTGLGVPSSMKAPSNPASTTSSNISPSMLTGLGSRLGRAIPK